VSADLDELFGDKGGAPAPRVKLIMRLLVTGLLLTLLGLACTAAPGGLMVLGAWLVVEAEMERVDNGFLPADAAADIGRLRAATFAALLVVLLVFAVQTVLFATGFYDVIWNRAVEWLVTHGFTLQQPAPPPP
jgi:hypothetical protein